MLFFDCETWSEVPIKNGTYTYCENAEMMIATWAVDDGPVQVWDVTADPEWPADLRYLLEDSDELVTAHNVLFDRNILRLGKNTKITVPIQRWRCTMVQALAHALPGSLDKLCTVMKVPQDQAKMKEGHDLVMLFCKPRPKNSKLRRATSATHPTEWEQFIEYAKADITAMRAVAHKLPAWNFGEGNPTGEKEIALWHLDQATNDFGFQVDTELAQAAVEATDKAQERLSGEVTSATDGHVQAATQRDKLLAFIFAEHGVALPDMQSATLERRLQDPDLPETIKELLRIRLQASMNSTSKYKTLLKAQTNGRLCGTLQFDGAGRTRRDAGRTFQPQNLPSRGLLAPEDVEIGIEYLKAGAAHLVYDNVMKLTSSAIRGCIVAPPGKKLVIADLANIEGRDGAWLAGAEWKLDAFRAFDTFELDGAGNKISDGKGDFLRVGPDLYKVAYSKAFKVNIASVEKPQRQIGKVMELMLAYAGGVGAFLTGAATYGFDVEELGETAWDTIPVDILDEAGGFYDWCVKQKRSTYGLSRRAFVVCDSLKRLWRRAHPEFVRTWRDLEDNSRLAIENPGKTFEFGKFKARRDGAWLRILLPSGRYLCYPDPRVGGDGSLSYMGPNTYTRQWQRISTYGGKSMEQSCQSLARDVMFDNLPRIEAAGYNVVLRVHDEVVCETPDSDEFNVAELSKLLSTNHEWCPDLPLAAAGFECVRYRKE